MAEDVQDVVGSDVGRVIRRGLAPERSVRSSSHNRPTKLIDIERARLVGMGVPLKEAGEAAAVLVSDGRALRGKPPVSKVKALDWAVSHARIGGVQAKDALDGTSWTLLLLARSSLSNLSSVLQLWAKTLPTRTQIEQQDRFKDDGRELTGLIQTMLSVREDEDSGVCEAAV